VSAGLGRRIAARRRPRVVASTLIDASGRHFGRAGLSSGGIDRQMPSSGLNELGQDASLDRRTWVESARDGWCTRGPTGRADRRRLLYGCDLFDASMGQPKDDSPITEPDPLDPRAAAGARPLSHFGSCGDKHDSQTDRWRLLGAVGDAASQIDHSPRREFSTP